MEMALIELYRLTADKRHLELARYLLAGDARMPFKPENYVYHFCGIPFTSRTHLEGHAVRAMYACCGAADYYLETGDQAYWKTLNVLWKDLVSAQMYVTGGVGARSGGEAFGDPYELPSARASGGDKIRNEWYDTTCCPPNLERTLASLPGYFYSTNSAGVYVHLYDNSLLDWHLENGTPLKVRQKTNYPWDGATEIVLTPAQPTEFTFFVRIPGWSDNAKVSVNGKSIAGAVAGQYLPIRRKWS